MKFAYNKNSLGFAQLLTLGITMIGAVLWITRPKGLFKGLLRHNILLDKFFKEV